MLKNQYNNGTLKLESKDIVDKSEVKYTEQKGKLKFEGNFRVEEPVLALKSEI